MCRERQANFKYCLKEKNDSATGVVHNVNRPVAWAKVSAKHYGYRRICDEIQYHVGMMETSKTRITKYISRVLEQSHVICCGKVCIIKNTISRQYTGLNIKYQVAMILEWYAHELDSVTPTASKDMIISVAVHHKIKVVHL